MWKTWGNFSQEKLSQKSVMSVCVISFPTGCIIFMTNYSICNDAEITGVPSHALWHTPGMGARRCHRLSKELDGKV